MTFKLSKEQLAKRAALVADLRTKAAAVNIAIAAAMSATGRTEQAQAPGRYRSRLWSEHSVAVATGPQQMKRCPPAGWR